LLSGVFAAGVLSCAALAQTAQVSFHIQAEPLRDALIDFAVQAKLSINVSDIDFHGAMSRPLDGTYSPADGLKHLLAGSELDFTFTDSSTVQIRARQASIDSTGPAAPDVERVVVTATKRQEMAQDVPNSIAVVTGRRLESYGIASSEDLTSQVAGLTATNLGPGEDKLFVRGLTDSVLPGLSESIVGVYLDDARIVDDSADPDLKLIDIDRVEVLRGPQGTLYGAGSLSGLVRIVTNKPDFDAFDMSAASTVSVTEDGGLSGEYQGVVNAPLIDDTLAMRVVGYGGRDAGYVDNARLRAADTNKTDVDGGRLSVGVNAGPAWTLLANVALQDTRAGDSQYFIQNLGAYNRDNLLSEPHSDLFLESGVTATGALGWAQLDSSTSFVDRSYRTQFDASDSWTSLTGFPAGPSPFDFHRANGAFTHETRLASQNGSSWQWLLGVFLDHRDEDFGSDLWGPDLAGANVVARVETREDRLNQAAVFGEATYEFAPGFTFTAGARAFTAEHRVSAASSGLIVGAPVRFEGSTSQSGAAPKFALKYEPDPDTTFYAQYSEGYRLGGINVDGPAGATGENEANFDPDILRNYEVGTKLALFGGMAFANADIYYADWSNVQSDEIAPDGAFYIVNAGRVRDPGFEFDFGASPLDGLDFEGNVFWNNASLSRGSALVNGNENGLPGAPSASAAISAEYRFMLDSGYAAFIRMTNAYVGSSHLGFSETTPGMGNYDVATFRTGVSRDSWELTLFADNLLNNRGNTFAFGNPFILQKQITPPRPLTVGLTVSWMR
jgi:outer membrane receptor protein involved in Fe transport